MKIIQKKYKNSIIYLNLNLKCLKFKVLNLLCTKDEKEASYLLCYTFLMLFWPKCKNSNGYIVIYTLTILKKFLK